MKRGGLNWKGPCFLKVLKKIAERKNERKYLTYMGDGVMIRVILILTILSLVIHLVELGVDLYPYL